MANDNTARYDDLIEIMNEERRRRKVIDFIDRNQGCTAEDIVNGQNRIGRVKVFRLIKDLKKENVILTDISQNNRRNKRLFLNATNPLISFSKEIKEFKNHLYPLFKRAQYHRPGWDPDKNEVYPSDILLGQCFSLFFEYLNINNYRAFAIWPDTIKDKETLSKLYMLFYSEMTKLNLELREKFQPVAFGVSMKKRKIIAKGMDREEYLTIAKNAAQDALAIAPGTLHFEKIQRAFYEFKLDDVSRPVVQFLMKIGDEIYDSQATESERESMREFREFKEESAEDEEYKLQRQKDLEERAKKLKKMARMRKKNRNNPYPYSDYDYYGSVQENYDALTGRSRKIWIPDVTPFFFRKKRRGSYIND
jgi:hypothetical protein